MNETETLQFIIKFSSTVMVVEVFWVLLFSIKLFKRAPTASKFPIVMTDIIMVIVGIYAVYTAIIGQPITINIYSISIVRSIFMLLMGLPTWIMLALIGAQLKDNPPGRRKIDET